ncbi:MAG: ABC transporter ATP-binding protein [Lachnospiraceae bacterium]|nr:ABC transporter ATP-binding protein [Lachnospiraceae bacterium]
MSGLLECRGVTKRFGSRLALDHVDLTIEGGHIVGLLGPNGSGKTTLIKLLNGLLVPNEGEILVQGGPVGVESKKVISYLPDNTYLNHNKRVRDILDYFEDWYADFDVIRAYDMLAKLGINPNDKLKTMSKGTKEKVQLILVMSRRAKLYVLDEPIAGVDPAARDYIMNTILSNYDPEASILIATHLIADVEQILDEVIFLQNGQIRIASSVEDIRMNQGKSVDTLFREVFRC